ncbi:MAG: hypothetical protein Q9182_007200 [Xanthomendoza sp. 2 TL-2023]
MAPEIPGHYFDQVKGKYFKIVPDWSSTAARSTYSTTAVAKAEHQETASGSDVSRVTDSLAWQTSQISPWNQVPRQAIGYMSIEASDAHCAKVDQEFLAGSREKLF